MPLRAHIRSILGRLALAAPLALLLACGGGGGGGTAVLSATGSWGQAQGLETNLLSDSYYPQVAVDATGRALVVWYRLSGPGGPADIWAEVYQPGLGWQGEGTLESMDGDARYPVVSVGGDGTFQVAWQHTPIGSPAGIWATRYQPGVGWSGPLQISQGASAAYSPALASDGYGNALLAWEQLGTSGYYEVQASRYSAVGTWAAPVVLGASTGAHSYNTRVAMDPAGNGMVAWNRAVDMTNGPSAICAVAYRAGSGWQGTASVPSLQAGVEGLDDAYGCSLAMSSAGAVLGWVETMSGAPYRPCARIWNPSTGAWSAAAMVATAQDASVPEVGMDASGKVHAAWLQYTGSDWNDLYVASYAPNGTWTVPTQPVDSLAGGIGLFSLSVNPAGTASLVWNQSTGVVASIFGLRYEPTRGWNAPAALEQDEAGTAYAPVVRLNAAGATFATWYQKDSGGLRHIYTNRWN